jgi:hypothetical protein
MRAACPTHLFPSCRSFQRIHQIPKPCVTFHNKLLFTARTCYTSHLAQPPSWRATPCRLFATAYSIYSQLPSISGGRVLHPQPEDAMPWWQGPT